MRHLKTYTALAGALAVLLLIAAAPAALSQDDQPQAERPMGDEHRHMHGQMQGEMPEGHAEMMEAHKEKMAEHKAAMESHLAKMEELIAKMNAATGDAKTDAVAAVITEMWSHHQSMREGMGMMMGGHGMMGGHPCPMHGTGECPMMKEKMEGDGEGHEGHHGTEQ